MTDRHHRLARVTNATAHRLRHVLRCAGPFDTLRGLATEYHRVAGAKVNRGRLRAALDVLVDADEIEVDDSGDALVVTLCHHEKPVETPTVEPAGDDEAPGGGDEWRDEIEARKHLTDEQWRNSDAGRAEEAERQAAIDAADADAKAHATPMPRDAKAWLEEKKRELERKRLEAEKLERE